MILVTLDQFHGVSIYFDEDGFYELKTYIEQVYNDKDHIHLLAGNELLEKGYNLPDQIVKHLLIKFDFNLSHTKDK